MDKQAASDMKLYALISLGLVATLSTRAAAEPKAVALASAAVAVGAAPDQCRQALVGQGGPPAWRVMRAASDGAGAIIAETSRSSVDYRYPACIFDQLKASDVELSVEFTARDGRVDRAAGLIFRVKDDRNYYVVRANALEDNVNLYRVVDGRRIEFAGAHLPVASGKTQSLRVRVTGDLITVFLNGARAFEAKDKTFTGAGAVGLWSKADSLVEFGNFSMDVLKE